jgi:integrase
VEAVLDWAKVRGYREGENPARWKGHLSNIFPPRSKARKVEHHPAMPYAEVPAFMASLRAEVGLAPDALEFTILTAARTDETLRAQWSEIDFDKALWTVPGDRMKKGREHRVPLSKPVLAILRERHAATGGQGFIFPGMRPKKPLSNMAMAKVLERMKRDDVTVHGFRSSFRDWVAESTNYPGAVAEAALAHILGDKTEAAYQRGDLFEKRRKLMDAWARYCTTPAKAADVIPIRRKVRATGPA